jgi:NADH dehydrogenase FAD-containing subunit
MRRERVVVIGGGFGGLNVVSALDGADVDVTVLDRTNHHLFQPLLYQVATGIPPARPDRARPPQRDQEAGQRPRAPRRRA